MAEEKENRSNFVRVSSFFYLFVVVVVENYDSGSDKNAIETITATAATTITAIKRHSRNSNTSGAYNDSISERMDLLKRKRSHT